MKTSRLWPMLQVEVEFRTELGMRYSAISE